MNELHKQQATVLIVDDSEMNRAILSDMLQNEYEIIEAENGTQALSALKEYGQDISVVLLDIVMPELDGFGVLREMNASGLIENIPVIIISSEIAAARVKQAFDLGATDFISRPFDTAVVRRRVVNTILLYAKQKRLEEMVAGEIRERERQNRLMINILSHIVEFRNGESGQHVNHIHVFTELLLQKLAEKGERYQLSNDEITRIGLAASLHDIGKIAVPEEILNKPGRLTPEEFEIIKTHTTVGDRMLGDMAEYKDEPLVQLACQICRWHHERYDGRGYPDGLKGDEIPLPAQVVSIADVYDALTSVRAYKDAYPHEKAMQMILDGECGAFSPLLLECLQEIGPSLKRAFQGEDDAAENDKNASERSKDTADSNKSATEYDHDRAMKLLERERIKYNVLAAMSQELQFEYDLTEHTVKINAWGADRLGVDEVIVLPKKNERVLQCMDKRDIRILTEELRSTTPQHPEVSYDCQIRINGVPRWHRIQARAIWTADETPPRYTGAIGKMVDIHDMRTQMDHLMRLASHDPLTGLLNHTYAKQRITERMNDRPEGKYALAILDLDNFKAANDVHGHLFGDKVLIHTAECLRRSIRSGDIAARVGGDEFLIFMEYKGNVTNVIRRVYDSLGGTYEGFELSVSMGVARTERLGSLDYDTLFRAADHALYVAKGSGKGQLQFFDSSMADAASAITPIDEEDDGPDEQA